MASYKEPPFKSAVHVQLRTEQRIRGATGSGFARKAIVAV
jgi:hypothetical protein